MGAAAKVRRGDIRHAIVVRTAKKVQRKDGMVVKFDDNACALIGKNGEPIGTRVNGKPTQLSSFSLGYPDAQFDSFHNTAKHHRRLLTPAGRSCGIGTAR